MFIYKPLLVVSLLQVFNLELINNPFNAVLLFSTTLILPLFGIYVLRFSSDEIRSGLLFLSSFLILSFVPYEIGLLKSIESGFDLSGFGEEFTGLIGPFQTVHSASTALAGAMLTILFFWCSHAYNRFYLTVLLLLGLYFLIHTYVRTGLVMVVVGAIPMVSYFIWRDKLMRVQLFLLSFLLLTITGFWVMDNKVLVDRVLGKRVNGAELESFEKLGSGRGLLYLYSVEIFWESSISEKIIGIGQTEEKKRMEAKLGKGLIPHNGFLLLLLNNGLFGLAAYVVFLVHVYKLNKLFVFEGKYLAMGLFWAYLAMSFFQNFDMIYAFYLFALSISYVAMDQHEKRSYYLKYLETTHANFN
ncbi:O-antigen ligase family protein [Echinicola sp. CAU 1574]|uniref:O-antigen ligase family protein n=1 Tax=Echinicola arenosa TaxID=2774144 RepID=A0ABR9AMN5_9BACT|nr:O-antigen ligase family protein [Echinicola arenosa]MBD8490058.1 O-antigen ligase family protein [Echinicola arenosa]